MAVSGKVQGKGNWKIWAGSQSLFGMRGTAAPAADAASADAHKRARADIVIPTDGSLDDTRAAVRRTIAELRSGALA